MKQNGYHLTKDTLVQEARPHMLGILGEISGRAFGSALVLLYVFSPFIFGDASQDIDYSDIVGISYINILGTLIGGFFLAGIIVYVTLVYLDLRRRKYEVYTDSIFYTE